MAYVQEGLCLYDHREGTNFSRCMWLMMRRVCDCVITGRGTNFSLCIWLMFRRVCGCLITGRELISVDACGFLLRGGLCLCDHSEGNNLSRFMWILLRCVCDCVITGRELISVDECSLC